MTPWDDVALGKLSRVLGPAAGAQMMTKMLAKVGLDSLESADDLHAFGECLTQEAGFAAPLGGLLIIHATLHGGMTKGKRSA